MSTILPSTRHGGEYPSGGADAREGLIACGLEFHRRGWSLGTSSNYSVVMGRDPLELLVTASGRHKERLTLADFVTVDEEGRPTQPDQPRSSAETLLHTAIAKARPDVGGILHTHSIYGTILSDLHFDNGAIHLTGYEMQKGLADVPSHETTIVVPIVENTQDIPTLATFVEDRLREDDTAWTHAFLIRKHGVYTWGRDLGEARRQIEVLEFLFECEYRRLTLARG